MTTVVVTRENVCLMASYCTLFGPQWISLLKFRWTWTWINISSFFPFIFFFASLPSCYSSCLSLRTGNSRICLPDHFHYRDISEDYCLWPGHAPKLLRQKRLEHAGLCHRHSGVSPEVAHNIHTVKGRNTHTYLCTCILTFSSPSFTWITSLYYSQYIQWQRCFSTCSHKYTHTHTVCTHIHCLVKSDGFSRPPGPSRTSM